MLDAPSDEKHEETTRGNGGPETEGRPTLRTEAFCGLAGKIVETIAPCTEADPVALLIQILVAFGNAVGRGPQTPPVSPRP